MLYKQTDGNQFSCNVYRHSTAKLLPLWKQLLLPGWHGACRTWKRTVGPLPFNLVEKGPPFFSVESFPVWSGIWCDKQELLESFDF